MKSVEDKRYKLSIVVGLFGRYELLISKFMFIVDELKGHTDTELIFVADGPNWTSVPLFQMLPIFFKNSKFIELDTICDLPAKLFNMGLESASGEFVTFIYPGCTNINQTVKNFLETNEFTDNIYAFQVSLPTGINVTNENRYGFLQTYNCYSPFHLFISTAVLRRIGGFNPSKALQVDFMQELTLRLSRDDSFASLGAPNHEAPFFYTYPFHRKFHLPKDLITRYIIRNCNPAFKKDNRIQVVQDFLQDLTEEDVERFSYITGSLREHRKLRHESKYKITVVGGYWEYHHNQICFFNYFEHLYGEGFCTYKSCLEELTVESDIENSDLVIFTRCRSNNSLKLISYCNSNNIPTIYMIDDNWITIAQDHPEYGSIFVEGDSNYDNFIEAIGKCKTTWVFNDHLIEDIKPFAKSITKFYISVEPNLFQSQNIRQKSDKLFVGFSGSLRYDDTAFQALAQVVKESKKDITIVLNGIVSKAQRELFNGLDVIELPFSNYSSYAQAISKVGLDLLIAPLTKTRTSMSKCYNKYIESAIVKAACIYSKVEPYTLVVYEGVNGYFVEDESLEGWKRKIEEVIAQPENLREVQINAYEDVMKKHTVEALLEDFVEKIELIIEAEEFKDD